MSSAACCSALYLVCLWHSGACRTEQSFPVGILQRALWEVMLVQGPGLPRGATPTLAVFCSRWTLCPSAGKMLFVVLSPGPLFRAALSGSGLVNHRVHRKPSS